MMSIKTRNILPWLVFTFAALGVACNPLPIDRIPSRTPSASPFTPYTATPTQPLPTNAPSLLPTAMPTPSGIALPSGVVYITKEGLWRVQADGVTKVTLGRFDNWWRADYDLRLSPDGNSIIRSSEGDLWLTDLDTGERRNLTNTPDRTECCAQWWSAKSDTVVFISWPIRTDSQGMCIDGYPTIVKTDGGNYRVLDETDRICSFVVAPSPDGQTIAYQEIAQINLYHPTGKVEFFKPQILGWSHTSFVLTRSAWSPDSKQLALDVMVVGVNNEIWSGFGIFDPQSGHAQLLHRYKPLGHDGPVAVSWSPDGSWLVVNVLDSDQSRIGLWMLRADGISPEEHRIASSGSSAVWSPDSHSLIVGTSLIEVGTWREQQLAFPQGATIIGWVNPSK